MEFCWFLRSVTFVDSNSFTFVCKPFNALQNIWVRIVAIGVAYQRRSGRGGRGKNMWDPFCSWTFDKRVKNATLGIQKPFRPPWGLK